MKNYIWIFIAIAIIVALAIIFKPDASKKLLELAQKDLKAKELLYKKKIDSVQSVREYELELYEQLLDQVNLELEIINNKFELQKQRAEQNEKELATYRNGDYNERYGVFSRTYNPEGNN